MGTFEHALDYLRQGGWVMAPLVACSVAMWTLIVERVATLRRLGTGGDLDLGAAVRLIVRADAVSADEDAAPRGAARPSRDLRHGPGLCRRIVDAFLADRTGDASLDREILRQCALRERPIIHRHLAVIAVLGSMAPLLGLLGTVFGMVEAFDVISRFGTGNARALAGGISVALVTTQTGLSIAVPGLVLSAVLRRRARRLELRLDEIVTALGRAVG